MAIYRMLNGMDFDEQSKKAMTTAYEVILVELGLTDLTDPITIAVASKIISLRQMELCDANHRSPPPVRQSLFRWRPSNAGGAQTVPRNPNEILRQACRPCSWGNGAAARQWLRAGLHGWPCRVTIQPGRQLRWLGSWGMNLDLDLKWMWLALTAMFAIGTLMWAMEY